MKSLNLNFNLPFEALYENEGLRKIDALFLKSLTKEERSDLCEARETNTSNSDFLISLAPDLENFLSSLFQIDLPKTQTMSAFFEFKLQFVQRKSIRFSKTQTELNPNLITSYLANNFTEIEFVDKVSQWLQDPLHFETEIEAALHYAAWAALIKKDPNSILFNLPQKLDFDDLIDQHHIKHIKREGFKLTDPGCDDALALDQSHYCIFCHKQNKDSCRTGLKDKQTHYFQKNPLGNELKGCPLDQKISEMNFLKAHGSDIGALAMVMIDNPLCAATGHRICNDCSKSCIFQKQSPVDIPQIETRILKNVLALEWGFEIYSLLSRWNPLNIAHPYPNESSGRSVLIVGQGPAGFNLAHHMLNLGHEVLAIDGVKIEPLKEKKLEPIYDIKTLYETLDDRVMAGFGGVAEYGITVRWDKNFLKIIRLLLERRSHYRLEGGIRFGGTLSIEDAFRTYGFDHIALCCGAGKPDLLPLKNILAKGVRQASDFLMSLQLTGAAKQNSLSNLQIRLPVIVVGGGLTAIDAATEALAYYPVQVEKFLCRYEQLDTLENLSDEDQQVAETFIKHAKILRKAKLEDPNFDPLPYLQDWGGVKLLYRKNLQASPAYRLNHEEVRYALAQGIEILEDTDLTEIKTDPYGHVSEICTSEKNYPAQTLLIAVGTKPNTVIGSEYPNYFEREGLFFKPIEKTHDFFIYENIEGQTISTLGDMHHAYSGSVVKAMASAKNAAPHIDQHIRLLPPHASQNLNLISSKAKLLSKKQLNDDWVEMVFKAPLQAAHYHIGNFFRCQTYTTNAKIINHTKLTTEALAMTPIDCDRAKGTLSFILSIQGTSSKLLSQLSTNDDILMMGPSGQRLVFDQNAKLLFLGEGIGKLVLNHYADQIKNIVIESDDIEGLNLDEFDQIIINGSAPFTKNLTHKINHPNVIAAINSPMQCMMKQICAQCLQLHIDPHTGIEKIVFSCVNPYQKANFVNFECYEDRLKQNALSEKVTQAFLENLLQCNPNS